MITAQQSTARQRFIGKTCRRCREEKPLAAFPVERRASDGRRAVCSACRTLAYAQARAGRVDGRKTSKCLTLDRLPKRITKDPATGCWNYTANRKRTGSGHVALYFRGVATFAHRAVYALVHGSVPEGLWVLHTCDNPRCVNPDHLYAGTPANNSRDMVERGRSLTGERNPKAKLTSDEVEEARRQRRQGIGTRRIAAGLGVNRTTIQRAVRGETWRTQ